MPFQKLFAGIISDGGHQIQPTGGDTHKGKLDRTLSCVRRVTILGWIGRLEQIGNGMILMMEQQRRLHGNKFYLLYSTSKEGMSQDLWVVPAHAFRKKPDTRCARSVRNSKSMLSQHPFRAR